MSGDTMAKLFQETPLQYLSAKQIFKETLLDLILHSIHILTLHGIKEGIHSYYHTVNTRL